MRTVALAEGMDPACRPSMLLDAVLLRRAGASALERDRATTLFNMACFGLVHGKDMTYWDVAGHLYPAEYVRRRRESAEIERMRADQMRVLQEFELRQARREMEHGRNRS